MTRHDMAGRKRAVERWRGLADIGSVRAAWMKFASRRRRQGASDLALNGARRRPLIRIWPRHGRQQCHGVGMQRARKYSFSGAELSQAAEIHHPDAGAEML